MALKNLDYFLNLVPASCYSPGEPLRSSYDEVGDVLYVHFKEPEPATDSELTDDDIILRYAGDEVIGITVLHASKR